MTSPHQRVCWLISRTYLRRVPRWWAGKGPAARQQISRPAVGWRDVVLLAAPNREDRRCCAVTTKPWQRCRGFVVTTHPLATRWHCDVAALACPHCTTQRNASYAAHPPQRR
ncbi:hypothetical protein FFY45_21660 [Xanthomonas hortorum]|nr:hypothetical protein [Xanthomonas hortorum]